MRRRDKPMNKRMQQEREAADKFMAATTGPDARDARHRIYLRAIRDHLAKHQYAPSVRELKDLVGVVSTSTVHRTLLQMVECRYITWGNYKARSLVITDWGKRQIQEVA